MDPADIAASYDAIAEMWSGDSFDRSNGIAQHERALTFCKRSTTALDVGCGSSGRIIDLLLREGFAVEGLDISPRMIELARARHPHIAFHQADICRWLPARDYDFIAAWDSIWHVPLSAQQAVLQKLFAALRPAGGVCIFTLGGTDEEEERTDSAMGPPMYYSTLGIRKTLAIVERAGCVCRHLEYDQPPEAHVYLIVERL